MSPEAFIAAAARHLPRNARLMFCQFRGDPGVQDRGRWRARVLDDHRQLDPKANVYMCVSAMKQNERGEWRRRKENFAGGLLLMIDDLGDGPGAKFPLSRLGKMKPTCLVETSPRNFQAVYMFDRFETDMNRFDALIRAFIDANFLGKDTGMAGINRVFRLPFGVNGKPKYNNFPVRCAEWAPECRYSVEELAKGFSLTLRTAGPPLPRGATEDRQALIQHFVQVRSMLRSCGMLKRELSDLSGWQDVVCPWTQEHTGAVDNGAALREPREENGWHGAFRCHHGGCADRGWRELTDWASEHDAEILENVNRAAK